MRLLLVVALMALCAQANVIKTAENVATEDKLPVPSMVVSKEVQVEQPSENSNDTNVPVQKDAKQVVSNEVPQSVKSAEPKVFMEQMPQAASVEASNEVSQILHPAKSKVSNVPQQQKQDVPPLPMVRTALNKEAINQKPKGPVELKKEATNQKPKAPVESKKEATNQKPQAPVEPKKPVSVSRGKAVVVSQEAQEKQRPIVTEIEANQVVAQQVEQQSSMEQPSNNVNSTRNSDVAVAKVEGSNNQVEQMAQPEGRIKMGESGGAHFPEEFYIVDPDTATNNPVTGSTTPHPTGVTHTHHHEHHYVHHKPSLFPFPPLFLHGDKFGSWYGGSQPGSQYGGGKPGQGQNDPYGSYYGGKPGYLAFPMMPIPFWKPGHGSMGNMTYNSGYPQEFYISERRSAANNEQQVNKQGLQLVGHIYLYTTSDSTGKQTEKGTMDVRPDNANPENQAGADIKIEEHFGNSQLLVQPVSYPIANQKGERYETNANQRNQINEIFRSLHLVHPSVVQQRSQSSVESTEDSAVLFAVEVPKPIYRFFKSVFGVFSY